MIAISIWTVLLLFAIGVGAGWLGAWLGIGGGIVLVPILVLGFGIDTKIAVATSLLAVIATSTAAGSVYVGRGQTNTRIAIALEISTTIGGMLGGLAALAVSSRALAGVFAVVMALTSIAMLRRSKVRDTGEVDKTEERVDGGEQAGRLAGTYYDARRGGVVHYQARRLAAGSCIALIAGAASGLLGVGGGFLKVPAMNLAMDVPIRVAVATSSFMIGVTAAASVFIYFGRGYVEPLLVAPLALGVAGGALVGTVSAGRASRSLLQRAVSVLLILVAVEMGLRASGVHVG